MFWILPTMAASGLESQISDSVESKIVLKNIGKYMMNLTKSFQFCLLIRPRGIAVSTMGS